MRRRRRGRHKRSTINEQIVADKEGALSITPGAFEGLPALQDFRGVLLSHVVW
ncbi:hypothetical protein DPMN_145800 [Dreissena polymorpha]|uniref:Uncharacterized protein n=1 Tax=Dreissena polymorpha TaxID=45954 RepID=A0A9D4IXV7_DREPO|nr:hypothetical protein DPMN_145800 [Dreissena polymorpha]